MSNPTSNFGWQMPTPTDLVTDLPADFEVFGQAVDTSMADLKGGTTGQILSKATNTDMDFVWTSLNPGDITGVTATSPLTGGGTSGDVTIGIQSASTTQAGAVQLSNSTSTTSSVLAATPTAVKSAYDLADSANSTATAAIPKSTVTTNGDLIYGTGSATVSRIGIGSSGQVLTVSAGIPSWATPSAGSSSSVNLLLNSNFALNQRAYVSAANLASGAYGFDRWKSNYTNTTLTFTASTQGQSLTINSSGGLQQIIEQGLVPAGTYTLSWTGTATARVYNSGATPPSYAASPVTFTADGTANVVVEFTASGATKTVSKVQFNAGTGTTWALATPTLQSELSACQRYYYRVGSVGGNAFTRFLTGTTISGTEVQTASLHPVSMRVAPTAIDYSGNFFINDGVTGYGATVLTLTGAGVQSTGINFTSSGMTPGRSNSIYSNNSTSVYFGLSAEL